MITGASQGLGAAFAEACARRGWNLLLCALPGTGLAELADRLSREHGVRVRFREADLARAEDRQSFAGFAREDGGSLRLLVNNAGFSRHGYFDLMPPEIPERMVQTNVLATLAITRELIPALAAGAPSSIITVASLSALRPMPLVSVYAASKAFLLSFGLALRAELAPRGISSTVLCPGPIPTSPEVRARIAAQGLGARLATLPPDDVAEAALRGALRRKAIVVPGLINKLVRCAARMIPRPLYMTMVRRRWKKALGRLRDSVDYAFFDER